MRKTLASQPEDVFNKKNKKNKKNNNNNNNNNANVDGDDDYDANNEDKNAINQC